MARLMEIKHEGNLSEDQLNLVIGFGAWVQAKTAMALGVSPFDVVKGFGVPVMDVSSKSVRAEEELAFDVLVSHSELSTQRHGGDPQAVIMIAG